MKELEELFWDSSDGVVDEHFVLEDAFPDLDEDIEDEAKYNLKKIFEQPDEIEVEDDEEEDDEDDEDDTTIDSIGLNIKQGNVIAVIARERKFNFTKSDLLYGKSYVEKATHFLQNYRFMLSLVNSVGDEEIKMILTDFIEDKKDLYLKILGLTTRLSKNFKFGTSSTNAQLTQILLQNEFEINEFIDKIFSLGKVVSQYDPDSEIGMY